MEKASMRSHSKAKAKEKENKNVSTAAQPDTLQGIAPIHKGTKAKAKVSEEYVTTAEKKATLQENAPKEKVTKAREKEMEKVSKEKVREPVAGERVCGQ